MQVQQHRFISYLSSTICSWHQRSHVISVFGWRYTDGAYRNISVSYNGIQDALHIPESDSRGATSSATAWLYLQKRGPKLVKPKDIIHFWKIRVGDKVTVISGKDKGKSGEVLACDKLRNQVKVKGCNLRKIVVDGQELHIEKKIHYSNVQLIDPLLNCATRVAIRFNKDNEPLRVSKKSGYVIPWPEEKPEEEKGSSENI
uniref:Large ribosomal subunit protein uL24c n=1 Tax=Babesia bovis TaxID=5865 RepID=A7AUS1_BABBO|eukprot:XP_001610250.1 50S ribosomal subunit L24 [Babesia bovis T2Bo]